ncbi:MAG: TetR/AcrR family transcriptional regulator [Anaerolineales bacterium]|nr:TetR/AcrR family transcriptional regulator [Anaerolineales bacterium]
MDNRSGSRSERRASMMRQQIIQAAAPLFAQKGFHKTTTKDIALAADVSEGSLYNYFKNKEDILLGIIEDVAQEEVEKMRLVESLSEAPSDYLFSRFMHQQEKVARLNPMILAIISELVSNPNVRRRYKSLFLSPIMELLADHLQARIDLGQIQNYPPKYLSRILISLTVGIYFFQMLEDDIVIKEWEEFSRTTVDVLFEGLKAEP